MLMMTERDLSGGTGKKLTHATIILAGFSSLIASLLSTVSIWHQTKNYRKPLLQRYVIRILLMVPIYSLSSWSSIVSLRAALVLDTVRDIYEAFTIYTFFQLLINFIGGERALIIMMHGREPVNQLWPMNYCLPKVDISDPHTFLAIKRGILQYAWLKPILGFASVIMKATDTYKEGYLGLDSGYLWSGIAYNLSVTLSLYSLGLFWCCMSKDLQPFRPVPKFLCIKLIIFASYWQGFFLSILVWLGAIPDNVEGYTSDNLAIAIQDTLICIEMPIFAMGHWYAFSWHDYADATISAARMPMKYALRDALGIRDLIEDTKETFSGKKYEYRLFDSGDNVLAHESSSSRNARMMEGMRYERGGKGKYWIPKPGKINARTPLISHENYSSRPQSRSPSKFTPESRKNSVSDNSNAEEQFLDVEEENLYDRARALEHGDWNYPVITANEAPNLVRFEAAHTLTTSSNRHLLQPTNYNQALRASNVKQKIEQATHKTQKDSGKCRNKKEASNPGSTYVLNRDNHDHYVKKILPSHSNLISANSDRSQLVDLVIEDITVKDADRVRAKKEGSSGWNKIESKRFLRTYGYHIGEDIREGFEPSSGFDNTNPESSVKERVERSEMYNHDKEGFDGSEESREWSEVNSPPFELRPKYGLAGEVFENVWGGGEPSEPPRENP